ncbi:MAG: BatA domain-containing protein [Planctomycetaceae bacterium]|nr:BatA domain-containing protein [Planctomycetaceae bacterium]
MSFLSTSFLVCGLAAIIPIFVHMIHRQNLRELPFASLRFIRISEQKTRNKRRIQDLFLLLLRMAVLALIAVGLANPTIRNLSNLWGGARTSAVIILDNSASMATVDGTSSRIDTALAQAEKILDELGNSDNIAIIVPCGAEFPENGQLFSSQDKVRKVLRDTKVSFEKANLAAVLQQARQLLVKAQTPSKLIFVISDQQSVSWQHLAVATSSAAPTTPTSPTSSDHSDKTSDKVAETHVAEQKEMLQIPVILVNCRQAPKPNVGLSRLDAKNILPIAQVPLSMTVYLKNESKLEQTRRLDVYVNGVKQYSSTDIKLEPEGQEGHTFTIVFDRGGLHKGEVRLAGNDGNPLDDKLYFAMEVDQGIPVAVIKPMRHEVPFLEETYYIEKALQTGAGGVSPIRLTTINKEDLLTEPLQNFAVVIAVNLPAPAQETAERLVQYVERGGHLIWTCGDNIFAEDYNRLNDEFGGKLLPLPILSQQAPDVDSGKDAWNIDSMDGNYPAFRNLVSPRDLYSRVLVYRRIPFDLSKGNAPTLATLNDGTPLLVQRRVGNGSVTFFGTGVHVSWTNLPIRPIFVPLINQLIFQLAGIEQTRLQVIAGQPLTFTFKVDECPRSVEIIPPSGEVLRRELKRTADNEINPVFVFEDTNQVGVYTLRPLETVRAVQIPFSVNIDGEELDSVGLTEADCKTFFAGTPYVFAHVGDEIDSTFERLKQGTSLWDIFLWAVLIILVCEAFISNRLSQRKEDQEKGVDVRQLLPRKTPSL